MPLKEGHSEDTVRENIRELIESGESRKRAIAIALSKAMEKGKNGRENRESIKQIKARLSRKRGYDGKFKKKNS